MKTFSQKMLRTVLLFLLLAAFAAVQSQTSYVTVNGTLKDAKTGEKISFAAITVPGTGIGTVSNSDGDFTLKVNISLNAEYFEVSHLGYATTKFRIDGGGRQEKTYTLESQPIRLQEISVVPKNAGEIACAFAEYGDDVGDAFHLGNLMAGQKDRFSGRRPIDHAFQELAADHGVQSGGGLVENQQIRLVGQGQR